MISIRLVPRSDERSDTATSFEHAQVWQILLPFKAYRFDRAQPLLAATQSISQLDIYDEQSRVSQLRPVNNTRSAQKRKNSNLSQPISNLFSTNYDTVHENTIFFRCDASKRLTTAQVSKAKLSPNCFFSHLQLRYFGSIDGHQYLQKCIGGN